MWRQERQCILLKYVDVPLRCAPPPDTKGWNVLLSADNTYTEKASNISFKFPKCLWSFLQKQGSWVWVLCRTLHWACGPSHQHHLFPSQQHSPVYFQKTTEDQRNQIHFVIYSKKIDKIPQQGPLQPAALAGQEASITCTAGQGTQRPRLCFCLQTA